MVPLQICKLHIVIGTNTSTYHRRLFNFVPFGLDFHDFQELYEMWTHQTRAHLMLCFNLSQMTLGQQRTLECYRMLLMYGFLLCIVDIQVQFSSLPLTGKNIFRFSESLNDIMDYRLTEHLNILESCPFKLAPGIIYQTQKRLMQGIYYRTLVLCGGHCVRLGNHQFINSCHDKPDYMLDVINMTNHSFSLLHFSIFAQRSALCFKWTTSQIILSELSNQAREGNNKTRWKQLIHGWTMCPGR